MIRPDVPAAQKQAQNRQAFSIAWRTMLVFVVFLTVIAGPIYYVLFADNLLDPGAVASRFWNLAFLWRLIAVLCVITLFAAIVGRSAIRQVQNPFMEVADSLRRITMRDFGVRITATRSREPREMAALTEAFNEMADALQRSEELRNTMMADVSHELRTPLTVLEGNLRAALDRVYPLDEAEIANLYGQTRHLIRLVEDLHELALADARRLPLDIQVTDLRMVIDETTQMFAPLAEEQQIALESHIGDLPPVRVDESRIRQVLHNLLTNALRHTPAGGTITVAGSVHAVADTSRREVILSVADTGEGLEPEQLSAVFDRFYRADRSRSRDTGGTGLGLAIVNAIVASHGGLISAASDGPGKGSRFEIRLPIEHRP